MRNAAASRIIFTAILAGACGVSAASPDIQSELRACRAEADDAKRLTCYDRLGDTKAASAPTPAAPAVAPTAAPPAAPQTQDDKFGSRDIRRQQEREAEEADPDRLKLLVARVTALTTQPNGTYIVTLDNGQVWRQTNVENHFRLAVGDEIRIRPASMGTYLLANKNGRSARVRRIQ